jgi:hypothetical protein
MLWFGTCFLETRVYLMRRGRVNLVLGYENDLIYYAAAGWPWVVAVTFSPGEFFRDFGKKSRPGTVIEETRFE